MLVLARTIKENAQYLFCIPCIAKDLIIIPQETQMKTESKYKVQRLANYAWG